MATEVWGHPGDNPSLAPPVVLTGNRGKDFALQVQAELKARGEPSVGITAYSDPGFIDTWIVTILDPALRHIPVAPPGMPNGGMWEGAASFMICPQSGDGGYTPADWAANQLREARRAVSEAKSTPGFGVGYWSEDESKWYAEKPAPVAPTPPPQPVTVPTTLGPNQISIAGMGVVTVPAGGPTPSPTVSPAALASFTATISPSPVGGKVSLTGLQAFITALKGIGVTGVNIAAGVEFTS